MRDRRPRRARRTLVTGLLGLLCAQAGMSGGVAAETGRAGGSLRIGVESEFQGFDPLQTALMGISTLTAATALYDTLVRLDASGRVHPGLALALRPSQDPLEWHATLRPGVRFHDGTPFDAASVAFHFSRLLDPANKCACRPFLAPLEHVEARGELDVVFRLKQPWAALPAVLGEPSVVSLIGSPAAIEDPAGDYHRHPVGTGPFVFHSWRSGDRLVVKRNEHYWQAGKPYLDAVEFRVLPDQQTRFASVRAGDVDLIWTVDAGSARKAEQSGELTLHTHVGAGARVLVLNTRAEHLQDRRVRRALAHASNIALYAEFSSEGRAPPASDPYGPGSEFACSGQVFPTYDPDQARRLLADYGERVELEFIHTATPRGRETAQIFQQFWAEIGVAVELLPLEQVQLVQRVLRGDYQLGAWRIRDSLDPDPDLFGLFHSHSPFNVTQLHSPALDAALLEGRSRSDPDQRRRAYCEIARIIAEEVPLIYLARNTYFAIATHRVQGLPPLRGGLIEVTDVWLAGPP